MTIIAKSEDIIPTNTVVGIFCEYEGKILLLHRKSEKVNGDRWGLPAGKAKKDESNFLAAKRELFEETGIVYEISENNCIGNFHVRDGDGPIFDFPMYKIIFDKEPKVVINNIEHDDYRWIDPKETLALPLIHDLDTCIKFAYQL